jgi:hypothetical protein
MISRRNIMLAAGAVTLALTFSVRAQTARPNVVIVIVDDQVRRASRAAVCALAERSAARARRCYGANTGAGFVADAARTLSHQTRPTNAL